MKGGAASRARKLRPCERRADTRDDSAPRPASLPTGALGIAAGLLGALLLLAAARPASRAFEQASARMADPAELTLFPTGPWVRAAALGRSRLAADFAWLEAIQYYGRHRLGDRRYPYAQTLFRTLTDLDPQFENAYVFGALILHGDAARPEAAYELLHRGIAANPGSWRLVFEVGFHRYLESKDHQEAWRYLSRAAAMPGAPDWVGRLAAFAASSAGEVDLARALWQTVRETATNAEIARIAERELRELEEG